MAPIQSGPSTPPLADVVAILDSWRKLIVVLGLMPVLTVLSPLLLWSFITIMNLISAGHGVLTSIGSLTLIACVRSMIFSYAPSAQEKDEALHQRRFMIPLLSFAFSRQFCVNLLDPLFAKFGATNLLYYTPRLPYKPALRLAGCMILLGLAVIVRFIGPCSIAQWRSLAARCSSFDNFLDLMALPSDKPGVLLQSPFQTLEVQSGRRYQNPYNPACLALVILSTLIGILLSYILHPSIPNNASPLVLSVTCSFSLLAHLMLCCLDGNSHEINPMRYLNLDPTKIFSFHFKLPNMSSIIFAAVAIMAGPIWTSSLSMTTWKLMGTCLMVATLSSIYLIAVNHFAQICLCLPMQQISWLIEGITGDFTVESTLDVVLCSILFGNSDLIKSIWSPTQKPGTLMMEDAEVERNEKSMETMSTLLLQKEVFSFGSHLEQDMLLVLFMESFGGGTNENSKRQQSTIKKFVHPKEETLSMTNSGQGEPCAVPLVRALCAYAGGLGLALSSISSFGSKTISPSKYASSFVTWSLPHGAIASAQWAITGASRFMLESMFHSGKTMSSWRCNHVSILIPIVLHAAFALQDGILKYDKTRSQGLGDLISLDVLPVVVACDNAALLILGKLQSFESSQKVDFHVHSDCRVWLEALLSRENKVSSEITPMLEQEHEHFMRPQRMFAYQ